MMAFLEIIARRLNMPIGALLCLLLVIGGLYVAIFEPYLLNRTNDVLIGAGLWGIAFIACWVGYGEEFWMSPKKLDEFRTTKLMESFEDENNERK